ncbi:DUF7507 domain-containing protein [Nocardioides campestrisoli]|uniref:DUF7507 domain-containing protein n=1 Tax=Nocardioides campestrisoli TaxID=2736757 RepID=UPI0015E6D38D|nr:CARDB domain-containing protein [Nocardioides campestrisoli]
MPNLRRAIVWIIASLMTTATLVVAPEALRAPASADPPTGGTTIVSETFTGSSVPDPAWTVQGETCLTGATTGPAPGEAQIPTCAGNRVGDVPPTGTPGYLQLTDESLQSAGSILYNRPVPATAGVSITFDQFQYGGTGADGIGFFLVDGSTDLTDPGGAGGSLGYAQRTAEGGSEPGIVGGVLGVGLDAFGNYYDDGEDRGAGCPADQRSPSTAEGAVAPNVITVRGPGEGTTGYCYLGSTTPANPADPDKPGTTLSGTLRARTLAASWRQVNVQVTPAPDPRVIVQVRYNPANPASPWVTELDIPAPSDLPSTYKFGLSGSTGGQNDVHLIRNAVVQTVNPLSALQLEKQVDRTGDPLPAVITAGTQIPYQYTVTNAGSETLSTLSIADDQITGPITCDSTTLPPAPATGSTTVCRGTYTVTADDVDAGEVVNTATATAVNPGGDDVTSPEATVTVPLVSSLALEKSVATDPPYSAGQVVEYSYTVTNTGGSTVTNVAVTDDLVTSADLVCESNVLAPAASTTCSGSYQVDTGQADPAGNIVNTAIATGVTPIGQDVESPEAQARIPVNTDIAVTKTIDEPTPDVGETVTFTVTATNNGPAAATDVVIEDQLPGGRLTLLSSSTAGPQASTYSATTGEWSIPALAVGNAVTLTITARVETNGVVSNTASLAELTQVDTDASNNSATVTLDARSLDLAVTKQVVGRNQVAAGETVTFRVTVTNEGPRPGTGITLSDPLPPGLDYRPGDSGGTGTYSPETDTWDVGSLAVGDSASFDFVLDTTVPGTFTNVASLATVSPVDVNSANNSASAGVEVRAPVADLAVVKGVSPQEAVVGETVTYSVTVLNRGPDPVAGIYVTDTGAEGVTVLDTEASQGTVDVPGLRWDVGTLAPGGSAELRITARLETVGTKVNVATVNAPYLDDANPEDNESTATVTTVAPAVDVGVTKSVDRAEGPGSTSDIPLGQDAVFTLTATNNPVAGQPATTVTNAVFADVLEEGLTFVSSTGDGTFDPETGTWSVDSLAVGATVTRTIRVTGTQVGQRTNTLALSTLDQRDTDPTNNSASATPEFVELADLEIDKEVQPAVAQPGDTVVYTIAVTNNGPNATDDITAADPAITAATIVDSTADVGTFDDELRIWTIPRLESGETATLRVSVRTSAAASGTYRNLVVIQESRVEDPEPDNNTAFTDLFVPAADIAVDKTVDEPNPVLGGTVTFAVGVRNLGPDTATGVTVDDRLPAGLTYVSSSATRGTYDPATGTWDIGDLAPLDPPSGGPQALLRITARASEAGAFPNTATSDRSDSFPYDPDPSNNTSRAVVTAGQAPGLTVEKSASPSTVTAAGQRVTYSFLVTNTGNVPVSGVAIAEDAFTGSGELPTPTCPAEAARLAPGASVVCTSTYTVTTADLRGEGLRNTARATGTDVTGGGVASPPDGATVTVDQPAAPRIRTRTSQKRVEPREEFHDRVRISGLARDTTVQATARLYGPFRSRAAASCGRQNLARTVTWRARSGWTKSPRVSVAAPGVYTWKVTTRATPANQAASTRCGLASETTTVAKPSYHVPVVDGGFSGIRGGPEAARVARTVIRALGFGLKARVVPTTIKRGRMQLPSDVAVTAWLNRSAGFGDRIGTAVVAGHVSDWYDRPGAMWGLRRAEPGQKVTVRSAGKNYRYQVTEVKKYDRTRKLPSRFFRTTGAHRLVLISCTDRVVYRNGRFHYTKYRVVVTKPVRGQ